MFPFFDTLGIISGGWLTDRAMCIVTSNRAYDIGWVGLVIRQCFFTHAPDTFVILCWLLFFHTSSLSNLRVFWATKKRNDQNAKKSMQRAKFYVQKNWQICCPIKEH
jgi:hypothetical protein